MPRPKSALRLFFGLFGWCTAIAAVFATVGVALAISAGDKARHFRDAGAETEAIVLALTEDHHRSGRRSHSHSYRVTYRFQSGPDTYTATASVPRDRFLALSEGDRIPVRYWTLDPNQSEIDPGAAKADSSAGVVIGIIAGVATVILGRLAWRDAAEAAWMARHGQPIPVDITGHTRTSIRVNGLPLWRAEWRNPDGSTGLSGRTVYDRPPKVGQSVTVLADPEGRRQSRLQSDICR